METGKRRFPWGAMLAISAAYATIYNPVYIRYILYDAMLVALDCTNMQIATLNTAAVITGIICMVPGGWIADKFSIKKIMVWFTLAMFPIALIAAFTTEYYPVQVICWAMMSACTTLGHWPATLKAIRIIGGKNNQSMAFGLFEAVQGLIATLTNSAAVFVFSLFASTVTGYRMAMISLGAFCALAAGLTALLFKDDKYKEVSAEVRKKFSIKETIAVLKNPDTYLIGVIILAIMGFRQATTYTSSYFTGVLGAALTFTGFVAVFRDYGTKVLAGPIAGPIADKIKSPTLLMVICLVICSIIVAVIKNTGADTPNIITIAIILVLGAAFFVGMAKSVMWATMDETAIPVNLTGTAIGVISLIGNSLPNVTFPIVAAYYMDTYADDLATAYDLYFRFVIIVCLIGAVAGVLILIRKHLRNKKAAAEVPQAE